MKNHKFVFHWKGHENLVLVKAHNSTEAKIKFLRHEKVNPLIFCDCVELVPQGWTTDKRIVTSI